MLIILDVFRVSVLPSNPVPSIEPIELSWRMRGHSWVEAVLLDAARPSSLTAKKAYVMGRRRLRKLPNCHRRRNVSGQFKQSIFASRVNLSMRRVDED
jgi:hypothetical protein